MLRRRLIAVLLVVSLSFAALPAFAQADANTCDAVLLVDGWVRATAPGMPNGAAYGLLVNLGDQADTLIGASSDVAEAVELHEMVMGDGDVMQMRPLADGIEVPAGGFTQLQPGGLHIMLINLQQPLVPGETVDFVLTFASQGEVAVTLPVIDPDAMDMMMMATEEPAMMETPSIVAPEGCAGLHFVGTWARPAVPGMPNSAAYGLALNLSETPERITGGATDAAEALELHEMVMGDGDVMQMRPLAEGIAVPPGGFALLQPGGLHVMLIGLTGALEAGDTLNVTLDLEQGGPVELAIPVRDPEAMSMDMMATDEPPMHGG